MIDSTTTLTELQSIPVEKWAGIWCVFDRWEFPEGLTKPRWWDGDEECHLRYAFMKPIMDHIMERISFKECIRESKKDEMSNEEFEDWWERKQASWNGPLIKNRID